MAEVELVKVRELMDAYKIYIPYIEEHGINSDIITQLINEHELVKTQTKYMRDRYEVSKDGIPILTRTIPHADPNRLDMLVNNKLNNTFDSDIVDTKIGYLLGHAINYVVEKDKVRNAEALIAELDKLRIRNNLPDKDATLGKRTSISGYGARLCYIALENNKPVVRIANKHAENCIFFYTESMSEPRYSMEYYPDVIVKPDGSKVNVVVADFYDGLNLYKFVKADSDFVSAAPFLHGFSFTPLFGVENNDELAGETQKVINLMNAYDRTLSDASNEIEASRLAILLLYNLGMDSDEVQKLKNAGVLEMWGDKIDAKYLTKDVNDSMIENHLNRLDENIIRFAKSVNFSDEAFSGNVSGIAIRFKTMALEHKAIIAENKLRAALQYQFKVICSAWAKLGICDPDDYLYIWMNFKRNLPVNITEEIEATAKLKGLVSEDTRLSLLSFVDDVAAEKLAMQQEEQSFKEELKPINELNQDDNVIETE